jgi:ureidoacrylate peracid hydrolase
MIDLTSSALLVVDMQNAFCHREGSYTKRGFSLVNIDSTILNVNRLIETFHKYDRLVIFTRSAFVPDYSDAGLLPELNPNFLSAKGLVDGSWDAQIIDSLEPLSNDPVITKKSYDAFYGTELDEVLQHTGTKTLVICGVTTDICVFSAVTNAFSRNIRPLLVCDATTTTSAERVHAVCNGIEGVWGWLSTTQDLCDKIQSFRRI